MPTDIMISEGIFAFAGFVSGLTGSERSSLSVCSVENQPSMSTQS